jgi:hypothetical protein
MWSTENDISLQQNKNEGHTWSWATQPEPINYLARQKDEIKA